MGNLSLFLGQLSESELDALEELNFSGKKAQLLDYLLSNCSPDPEVISEELNISTNHFYKLSSIILHKIYGYFTPKTSERLVFLGRKGLKKHLEMEFNRLNSKYHSGDDAQIDLQLSAFHAFGFEVFRGEGFQNQVQIAEQLRKLSGNKELISVIFCQLKRNAIRWGKALPIESHDELDTIACRFYQLRLESDLQAKGGNLQIALERAKAALSLDVMLEELIPDWEAQEVYFELADIYDLMGRHEQAFQIFHHRFSVYPSLNDYFPEYHNRYLNHLLLRKEFDLIHERLSGCCPQIGQLDNRRGCFRYYLIYALMYLFRDRIKASYSFIRRYQEQAQEQGNEMDRLDARKLETLYFAYSRDSSLLDSLLKKNIKFLQRRGHKAGESEDLDFFRLIQAMVSNDGIVPEKRNLAQRMDDLQKCRKGVWGRMLLDLAKKLQTETV